MESVDQVKQLDHATRDNEYSEVLLDEDQPDQLEDEEQEDQEPRITIHESVRPAASSKESVSNHVDADEEVAAATTLPQEGSNEEKSISSSASSPVPASPHKTRFTVTVKHAKECTGEIITYLVTSKRLFDDKGAGGEGRVYSVMRVYEDFEFLDQCLIMAAFAGQCLSHVRNHVIT